MEHITRVMMQLIRGVIFSAPIPENLCEGLDEAALASLYSLSKHHDVAHIVAAGLERCGGCMSSELAAKFAKQKTLAAFRYSIQKNELAAICEVLEEARIEFIPLKGSVLRDYYPEGWMRTSSDIDVLVKGEDIERARDALAEELGYEYVDAYTHHWTLNSPGGVHLELHHALMHNSAFEKFEVVLDKFWEHSSPKNGGYERVVSDEMFYYFHMAHMAKHYMNGGCGARSFIDVLILQNINKDNRAAREALLAEGGLSVFERNAVQLAEAWFAGKEHTRITRGMEQFIMKGGTYGHENHYVIERSKRGGKIRYVLSRLWLSYPNLKKQYPSLNHKIFIPFYQARRWCRLLFSAKGRRQSFGQIRTLGEVTQNEQNFVKEHLKELDL